MHDSVGIIKVRLAEQHQSSPDPKIGNNVETPSMEQRGIIDANSDKSYVSLLKVTVYLKIIYWTAINKHKAELCDSVKVKLIPRMPVK